MVYIVGNPYLEEYSQPIPEPIVTPLESESLEPLEAVTIITNQPFYIKGIINGLAATTSLWIFWTPFIIFVARPLINSQLKGVICQEFSNIALQYGNNVIDTWNNAVNNYLYSLYATGKINLEQLQQLTNEYIISYQVLSTEQPIPPEIQAKLDNNPQKNWNDNLPLIIIFAITFGCVIIFCLTAITTLCQMYNINSYEIFKFNLIMTLIVVIIEGSFFAGVAMQYNPYDLNFAVKELESNVLNMFQ
jgi:hypothetical protein